MSGINTKGVGGSTRAIGEITKEMGIADEGSSRGGAFGQGGSGLPALPRYSVDTWMV